MLIWKTFPQWLEICNSGIKLRCQYSEETKCIVVILYIAEFYFIVNG